MTATSPDLLADVDPFSHEFQQNPFPFYDAMRAASPAWYVASRNMYIVTSYAHVTAVLKDPATFSSALGATVNEPPAEHLREQIAQIKSAGWVRPPTMLTVDPPDHTRYRGTVAKAFNARVIANLRPALEQIVAEEIDAFIHDGHADFKTVFSDTVPVRVIVRALDLPEESQADVKRWSDDTTAGIGSLLPDDRAIEAAHGVVELQRFMNAEILKRHTCPSGDIISMLVDADFPLPDGGTRKLTMEESMGILQALIGAGNETTTKLFSAMLVNLAEHHDEWWALKADPSRAPLIVEEALRLATPTQGQYRVATRDTDIGGVPIPAGSKVFVAFAAANRDPAVFEDPHAFRPDRPNVREHVSFGLGVHFCIGAPLSRLESVIALEQLAARWEDFHLTDENTYEYEPSYVLRGLTHCHVAFTPASP